MLKDQIKPIIVSYNDVDLHDYWIDTCMIYTSISIKDKDENGFVSNIDTIKICIDMRYATSIYADIYEMSILNNNNGIKEYNLYPIQNVYDYGKICVDFNLNSIWIITTKPNPIRSIKNYIIKLLPDDEDSSDNSDIYASILDKLGYILFHEIYGGLSNPL